MQRLLVLLLLVTILHYIKIKSVYAAPNYQNNIWFAQGSKTQSSSPSDPSTHEDIYDLDKWSDGQTQDLSSSSSEASEKSENEELSSEVKSSETSSARTGKTGKTGKLGSSSKNPKSSGKTGSGNAKTSSEKDGKSAVKHTNGDSSNKEQSSSSDTKKKKGDSWGATWSPHPLTTIPGATTPKLTTAKPTTLRPVESISSKSSSSETKTPDKGSSSSSSSESGLNLPRPAPTNNGGGGGSDSVKSGGDNSQSIINDGGPFGKIEKSRIPPPTMKPRTRSDGLLLNGLPNWNFTPLRGFTVDPLLNVVGPPTFPVQRDDNALDLVYEENKGKGGEEIQ